LVDDMRKKIDTLKSQLADLENKINQMDAEWPHSSNTRI
jgi:uncharacterized protein YukE